MLAFFDKGLFLGFRHSTWRSKAGEKWKLNQRDEKLGRLKPEEKVAITIDMTDACVRVCASGIMKRSPDISDKELRNRLKT